MPLPTPQPNETEAEFMRRCMADDTMVEDFPDNGQRFAVCRATLGLDDEVDDGEDDQEDYPD